MINLRGQSLKTRLSEMTIKEYEQVVRSLNNTKGLRKWLEILMICGFKNTKELTTLRVDEVSGFIDELNTIRENEKDLKALPSFEHNSRVYRAFDDEADFDPSFKDLSELEKIVKKDGSISFCEALAIVYKDEQLTHVEHYDKNHIKFKASFIAEMPAILCVPIMTKIALVVSAVQEGEQAEIINEMVHNAVAK